MDVEGAEKRKNKRGRAAPTRIPKLVTHLVVADQFGVGPETIRRWSLSDPPLFPRPHWVSGQFLFFKEAEIIALIERGDWHHPSE